MQTDTSVKSIIEDFFNDQFHETSQFFLYKDKKLLKEEKYTEYAQEQLKKARNIFLSISGSLFFTIWYSITSLMDYGNNGSYLSLSVGIGLWLFFAGTVFFATKQYYTIKSSMSMLIKLVERENEKA